MVCTHFRIISYPHCPSNFQKETIEKKLSKGCIKWDRKICAFVIKCVSGETIMHFYLCGSENTPLTWFWSLNYLRMTVKFLLG